jgi:predicted ATPase
MGYSGVSIDRAKLRKIIYCLNIKSHKLDRVSEPMVYFPEVLWAIFHSVIGSNDEKVKSCEQVQFIMRELKRKYRGLGKRITPDRLCGNVYYKNEMTVSKYLAAAQIAKAWRA